jgi:hypothetical protein
MTTLPTTTCASQTATPPTPRIMATLADQWKLEAREVPLKGRGVFPGVTIPSGSLVLKFEGPIFTKETCPDFSEAIQVRPMCVWGGGGDWHTSSQGVGRAVRG